MVRTQKAGVSDKVRDGEHLGLAGMGWLKQHGTDGYWRSVGQGLQCWVLARVPQEDGRSGEGGWEPGVFVEEVDPSRP